MDIKSTARKYWYVLAGGIILLIVLIMLFTSCGNSNEPSSTTPGTTCPPTHGVTTAQNICLPKIGCGQDCQINRPDGGYVYLETGIQDEAVRKRISDAVIAGVEQTIRSATYHNPNWTSHVATGNYNVYMIKKHATNQDGTPALITSGIQTAGTVINTWRDGVQRAPLYIILPQPEAANLSDETYWSYLKNSARHEGEHVIEYGNAIGVFIDKAVTGDVHPHWSMPPGEEAKGLVARAAPACRVEASENGPAFVVK